MCRRTLGTWWRDGSDGESNNAISLQAETAGGAAGVAMEVELKLLTTPA
jgi:hypothetical protein